MDYLLLVLVLLVVLIPPLMMQRRQRRQIEAIHTMQENLRIGDRVITTAGLHGTVAALEEGTVELHVAEGVVMTFDKFAVVRKVEQEAGTESSPSSPAETDTTEG